MISISKQARKNPSLKAVYEHEDQAMFTTTVIMRSINDYEAGDTSHPPLNTRNTHTYSQSPPKSTHATHIQKRNIRDSCYTKGRQVVGGESRQVEESSPHHHHRRYVELRLCLARETKKGKCPQNHFILILSFVCIACICYALYRSLQFRFKC